VVTIAIQDIDDDRETIAGLDKNAIGPKSYECCRYLKKIINKLKMKWIYFKASKPD
jgi:hypothetical protein